MDISLYFTFLIVSFGLIIVPGPNVLVIVSTSMTHGKRRGLQTVAGTSFAMLLQLCLVAMGTAWFVQLVADGLTYLKWAGVVYLLYLGLYHLNKAGNPVEQATDMTASASFTRGFLVSLSNPKTLLFFSAFLPQFVSAESDYALQIFLLSMSFLGMAIVLDSCYALLSSKLTFLLKHRYLRSARHGLSGLLFIGAGAWLAATKRSA